MILFHVIVIALVSLLVLATEVLTQGLNFEAYSDKRWPESSFNGTKYSGVIPYRIIGYTLTEKDKMTTAIAKFNKNGCVIFRILPGTQPIPVNSRNYVEFRKVKGCSSRIGKRPTPDRQRISLTEECLDDQKLILRHLLRCAGFNYEHNRYDRDNFIQLIKENVPPKVYRSKFVIPHQGQFIDMGDYDYYNIMHSPVRPRESSKPYFKFTQEKVDERCVGSGSTFSTVTIPRIRKLYECET